MAQCRGTTKAGARCKRDAVEGLEFCPMHEDQDATTSEPGCAARDCERRDDLLVIGALAVGFLVLRRLLRLV